MVAMTTALLRAEIDTDPKTLGYAALRVQTNAPQALAARLNETGASAEVLFKAYVPIEDVVACIVRAEYDALSATAKTFLGDCLLKGTRLKSGDANLRASMIGVFAAGATRTALTNIASRPATRAEALWGEGANVSDQNVASALEA